MQKNPVKQFVSSLVMTALMGLIAFLLRKALAIAMGEESMPGFIQGEDEMMTKAKSFVGPPPTSPTLDDVGGHDAIKEDLRRSIVLPLTHAKVFYAPDVPRSVRPPRGVLLHGPPGTGKTLLAKAAACESKASFMCLHSANLESKWFGETPKLLQAAFKVAKAQAPCIVFFDEIDGLGRARGEQDQSCVYAFKCELLRALDDGADPTSPVVVIACTNCPNALDPAVSRRFQRSILVAAPNPQERLDILRTFGGQGPAVATLAARAAGWTGADLAMVYERACSQRVFNHADVNDILIDVDSARELESKLPALSVDDIERAARDCGKHLVPVVEKNSKPPTNK